ncbi:MAG: helix-turn-helix domain-containing protein [Caulobacterales bacterium]|nr:helix-turn-helix domain-containing protein [Caulobacterales bacterium]MCA0371226.1 helix-turn-helix domain-containing protein [Pseudomonadota bacterium]
MEKELFNDLVKSLEEARDISTGKSKPSRSFKVESQSVRETREKIGLTQVEFASLLRVSIKTLQNWEQMRRTPTGPAAALLRIVANDPQLAIKSLRSA